MSSPFDSIPDVPTISERFAFIDNIKTRENAAICLQYVIFLMVSRNFTPIGPIKLSINRDIIVHTASIIELVVHYCLKIKVDNGELSLDDMPKETKVIEKKLIHRIAENEELVWGKQVRVPKAFNKHPKADDLFKAAKNINLFTDELYTKAIAIRDARNKIHLINKEGVSLYPSDENVDQMFNDTKEILDVIQASL